MFLNDQPITSSSFDRLDRANFAKNLAKAILSYNSKEPIVLGVIGDWGSGKSSILNMCIEEIKEKIKNNNKYLLINFNPWNYSGSEKLISSFFYRLQSCLSIEFKNKYRNIIKKINEYADAYIPFEVSANFFGISVKNKKLKECEIERIKETISDNLKDIDFKIIVVIDDIDRLNDNEIRQIFQLIKVSGNFPNMIYLVAFDQNVVSNALNTEQKGTGEEYIKKIIQIPFGIPQIQKSKLFGIFLEQLNEIIKSINEEEWDNNKKYYFDLIFDKGIKYFIKTIRDVNRLINYLKLGLPFVKNEVNTIDFIAISAIQLFFPKLYNEISNNKDLFTVIYDTNTDNKKKQFEKNQLDNIFKLVDESEVDILKELIKQIFPKVDTIYSNMNYGISSIPEWRRELRICSNEIFDVYFQLTVTDKIISQSELETIIKNTNNEKKFITILKNYIENKKIAVFLDTFEDYINDIPIENIKYVIFGMINKANKIPENKRGFLGIFDNYFSIRRIIYKLLKKILDEKERYIILKRAILKSEGIYVLTDLISHLEAGKKKEEEIINENQINELKKIIINKIEKKASQNILKNENHFNYILYKWKQWGEEGKVINYVNSITKSDLGLIKFLVDIVKPYSKGIPLNRVVVEVKKIFEEYLDLKTIKDRFINIKKSIKEKYFDDFELKVLNELFRIIQ